MTKLEKLLAECCPDGVEYRQLKDITREINIGINPRKFFKLNPDGADCFYVTVRELNGLQGVKQYEKTDLIDNEAVRIINDRAKIQKGDILFSNTGTVGKLALVNETPNNWGVNEGIYVIKPIKETISSRFLYYYLSGKAAYKDYSAKFTGSTLKHVTQAALSSLAIPVPPLEVQAEIVRILDNFTELTAELTARKKQYEYYREQILSEIKNAKMCELQEIVAEDCSISYGIVQTGDDVEDGVPVVRPVDLTSKIVSLNGLKKVSSSISDSYKRTVLKGGDLLVCVRGTTGVISIAAEELNGCNVSRGIVPLTFKDDICKDYVYYQLIGNAIQETIQAKTKGTALKQINMEDLRHILIPIPPIEEQERIVSILDRFDKLCNDISEGLPAEIEARRKQYEYYRDKLLTFTPKE